MRSVVVLPHPEGPRRVTNSPSPISRFTFFTAARRLNSLETFSSCSFLGISAPGVLSSGVPAGAPRPVMRLTVAYFFWALSWNREFHFSIRAGLFLADQGKSMGASFISSNLGSGSVLSPTTPVRVTTPLYL